VSRCQHPAGYNWILLLGLGHFWYMWTLVCMKLILVNVLFWFFVRDMIHYWRCNVTWLSKLDEQVISFGQVGNRSDGNSARSAVEEWTIDAVGLDTGNCCQQQSYKSITVSLSIWRFWNPWSCSVICPPSCVIKKKCREDSSEQSGMKQWRCGDDCGDIQEHTAAASTQIILGCQRFGFYTQTIALSWHS